MNDPKYQLEDPATNRITAMKRNPKTSPLHEAVMLNDVAAVQSAIESGENVDTRDVEGRTPLFYAIQDGHLDIATELLRIGS